MTEAVKKGPIKGNQIISNLINGAGKACLEYIEMSGRASPGFAPESFIQAGAARALKKLEGTHVVLEESVAKTYNSATPPKPGPTRSAVSKGRYDIVAYWKSGKPRAAIEVKSPVNALAKQKFDKDFNRLIETMNGHPDAKFQYGIFLFLTVKKGRGSDFAKAKLEIDGLVKKLGEEAVAMSNKKTNGRIKVLQYEGKSYSLRTEDAQGAWRVSALVFKR
jgi:hypothetical protein